MADDILIKILTEMLAVMERVEAKLDNLTAADESAEMDLDGVPVPKPSTLFDHL